MMPSAATWGSASIVFMSLIGPQGIFAASSTSIQCSQLRDFRMSSSTASRDGLFSTRSRFVA